MADPFAGESTTRPYGHQDRDDSGLGSGCAPTSRIVKRSSSEPLPVWSIAPYSALRSSPGSVSLKESMSAGSGRSDFGYAYPRVP